MQTWGASDLILVMPGRGGDRSTNKTLFAVAQQVVGYKPHYDASRDDPIEVCHVSSTCFDTHARKIKSIRYLPYQHWSMVLVVTFGVVLGKDSTIKWILFYRRTLSAFLVGQRQQTRYSARSCVENCDNELGNPKTSVSKIAVTIVFLSRRLKEREGP